MRTTVRKELLLTGIAAVAVATASGTANAQLSGSAEGHIAYNNNIDTSVVNEVTFTKNVDLAGEIRLDGDTDVNSEAEAVDDNKQLMHKNAVQFQQDRQKGKK